MITPRQRSHSRLTFLVCLTAAFLPLSAHAAEPTAPNRDFLTAPLQPGGVAYGYIDYRGDLEKILGQLTKDFSSEETVALGAFSLKQNYVQIASDLGLLQISGLSFSSVKNGDGYENRTFLAIDGPRQGLLAALGGNTAALPGATRAPADADLFIDFELNTSAAIKSIVATVARFDPIAAGKMALELEGKKKAGEPSPLEFMHALSLLKGRVTLWLTLDQAAASRPPQFFLRIEGPGKIAQGWLERSKADSKKTINGRDLYLMSELEDGDRRPAIWIDGNAVIIADSPEQIEASLNRSANSLATSPAFTQAMSSIGGEKANAILYVSPSFRDKALNALGTTMAMSPLGFSGSFTEIFSRLLPPQNSPILTALHNRPDGLLFHSLEPYSNKRALFAYGLLNPELLGLYADASLRALHISAVQTDRAEKARPKIYAQLEQIDAAAENFFAVTSEATEADWPALLAFAPTLSALQSINGEKYHELTFTRGNPVIEIYMRDFASVRYIRSLKPAQETQIKANLRILDEIACRYFAQNPGQETMYFNDATAFLHTFPALISQAGEDYANLTVRANTTTIEINLPGDRLVSIDRDPSFTWQARRALLRENEILIEKLQPAFNAAQAYFAHEENRNSTSVYLSSLISNGATPMPDISSAQPVESPTPPLIHPEPQAAAAIAIDASIVDVARASDSAMALPAVISEPTPSFDITFNRGNYEVEFYHDGKTHKLLFPLEPEKRSRIDANLKTIARAAAPILAKTKEIVLYAGELIGPGQPLKTLPEPVSGETYSSLELRPGDQTLTLALPTGHTHSVPIPAGKVSP